MRNQLSAIVLCIALGSSVSARADGSAGLDEARQPGGTSPAQHWADPKGRAQEAQRVVNAGTALTIVGALFATIAIGAGISYGMGHPSNTLDSAPFVAIATSVPAVALLGAGIPLTAVGIHRLRKAGRLAVLPIASVVQSTKGAGGAASLSLSF
jgi:hypothetical protein